MKTSHNVLIVTSSLKSKYVLIDLFKEMDGYYQIKCVESGNEARRDLITMNYDIILINFPLNDESGELLSVDIAQSTTSGVILIVKNDCIDEINSHVENYGVLTLAKPISRMLFQQMIKLSVVNNNRWLRLEKENEKLKGKLEEARLVSKAKCLLISNKKYTEEKAHHYLEQEAMDKRISKSEFAMQIIRKYQN